MLLVYKAVIGSCTKPWRSHICFHIYHLHWFLTLNCMWRGHLSGCEAPKGGHFFLHMTLTIEGRDKRTLCLSPRFHSTKPRPQLVVSLQFYFSLSGHLRGTHVRRERVKALSGSSHWSLLELVCWFFSAGVSLTSPWSPDTNCSCSTHIGWGALPWQCLLRHYNYSLLSENSIV